VSLVLVPDIGDFADVPIIEVFVKVGDDVAADDPLLTLESDKATMDVPAPEAGTVTEVLVKVGDKVSEGTAIVSLSGRALDGPAASQATAGEETPNAGARNAAPAKEGDRHAQLVVIGAGPGGYTAAFRAADLGVETILVEREPTLGGVCLNVGCIPSKSLLHLARVIAEADEAAVHGVRFGAPKIELDDVREFKAQTVKRLTDGLEGLARQRKVEVIRGSARFVGPHLVAVDHADGATTVSFDHCIIATGSTATRLPNLPDDPRIMDSTGALGLVDIPKRLLVIGGGIIGFELATVYDALGSRVTVVELTDQLIPGCDPDLVKPLHERMKTRLEAIRLTTLVSEVKAKRDGLHVSFDGDANPAVFDRVLVAVGRQPNGASIDAGAAGVEVDERGYIQADRQQRTNVPHIYAIGDVVGAPMLAHKATHEAKVAAEVIAGHAVTFDARSIPSVAYTDPEVAWTGLTETHAKAKSIPYEVARFPWAASGRALGVGRPDGLTKLLFDPTSHRVLGAGITGVNAGELIAEVCHAIEMTADLDDLGLTVHPHPTLSETVAMAAEAGAGTITDLPNPKAAKR
jgi:dihydrolipoamide dehydrogenase